MGEDLDNPKITFHEINFLLEVFYLNFKLKDRIKDLQKRMQVFIKDFDRDQQTYLEVVNQAKQEIDNMENDNFVEIKNTFIKCTDEIEDQKSYNLLLQKQITSLKKEKVDTSIQINNLNAKLDNIEKDLGIIVNSRRLKKTK